MSEHGYFKYYCPKCGYERYEEKTFADEWGFMGHVCPNGCKKEVAQPLYFTIVQDKDKDG